MGEVVVVEEEEKGTPVCSRVLGPDVCDSPFRLRLVIVVVVVKEGPKRRSPGTLLGARRRA